MKRLPIGDDENIGTLPDRAAEVFPDVAFDLHVPSTVFPEVGTSVNLARVASLIAEASGWLAAAGIERGCRVAIIKRNHSDTVLLAAAAARIGAVPALISPMLPRDDTRALMDRLQPSHLIADRDGLRRCTVPFLKSRSIRALALEGRSKYAMPLDALRGAGPVIPNPVPPDAPMAITHTSGTTGVPKLVVHAARTIAVRARAHSLRVPGLSARRSDRAAVFIMWIHARALDGFSAVMHLGMPTLALADLSPEVVARALASFRPTIVEALPGAFMLWEPLTATQPDLFRQTRMFVNTFDAIHPRTVRAFLSAAGTRLPIWVQAYGQSEAGGVSIALYTRRTFRPRKNGQPRGARTQGWPIPGIASIRVTDRGTGTPLKRGQVGQFEVRSDGLALTYLGQEELHRKRGRGDWWTMGDVGVMTRLRRVELYDRDIDWVPALGSCLAVEDRLLDELPDLSEVVIVRLGDRAVPVVSTHGDRPIDLVRWADAVKGLPLEPPVHVAWDDIPRTPTFKVRRRVLADQLEKRGA